MSSINKVTFVKDKSNADMNKQYVRDLKSSDGNMANYGKKINSGAKPGTISEHEATGCMGYNVRRRGSKNSSY